MKKMFKQIVAGMCITALASTVLVGCGSKGEGVESSASGTKKEETKSKEKRGMK